MQAKILAFVISCYTLSEIDILKLKKLYSKYVIPLIELFPDVPDELILLQTHIVTYTYFMDDYWDNNSDSKEIILLILNNIKKIIDLEYVGFGNIFDSYNNQNLQYLIDEKHLTNDEYLKKYGEDNRISKAVVLLFITEFFQNKDLINEYINFLSFMLLVDDILDYKEDYINGTITFVTANKSQNTYRKCIDIYYELSALLINSHSPTICDEVLAINKFFLRHKEEYFSCTE